MLHFIERKTRPAVSEGLDAEALAKFKTVDETVFVAYVGEDRAVAEMFADAARAYGDEFTFGTVVDSTVIEAQGLEPPAVVCYKLLDGDTVVLKEIKGAHELNAWIVETSRPVLGELTVLNQKRLADRGFPIVYLFAGTESDRQSLRKTLYKFARSYYDSLTSVVVDPFQFPDLMSRLGLEPGVFPAGAVHQLSKDRIYPYPKGQSFSANAVQQWGLDVYQGRIKPWTPPGVTTTYDDLGPTRAATRKVSIPNIPGVKVKIAGHDEL
ncbi:Protein disulfide-isomerase [Madurella mycetomatis]|uniref:Protein disulfide-isomerase n=1 Tax=Madurella mycetomatis TaxID=100816 RepID=A0A175W2M4_9PEZI|nr:Protein disulfide-isomerase [Madurella mycetomatis]